MATMQTGGLEQYILIQMLKQKLKIQSLKETLLDGTVEHYSPTANLK